MTILVDVIKELAAMFVADARLSVSIIALVAIVWFLASVLAVPQLADGAILAFGCVALLIESAVRDGRRRTRK